MEKKKSRRLIIISIISFFVLIFIAGEYRSLFAKINSRPLNSTRSKEQTLTNVVTSIEKMYGTEIDLFAKQQNLPSSYFKSLIILETSGIKPAPSRYEPQVYKQLKSVKEGKRKSYTGIKKETLKNFSDAYLKKLSTSWGPFQIMGYHSIKLKITVDELKGLNSLTWGMKWITAAYGEYLEKEKYKDAFHIHNTGKEFPNSGKAHTTNPEYVNNGIKYMNLFKL